MDLILSYSHFMTFDLKGPKTSASLFPLHKSHDWLRPSLSVKEGEKKNISKKGVVKDRHISLHI